MEIQKVSLARIAACYNGRNVLMLRNSTFESVLKCSDLDSYWDQYHCYLEPYSYNLYNGRTYKNDNEMFDAFIGLNSIFEELLSQNDGEHIITLLVELAKHININWASENKEGFLILSNLYAHMGLSLSLDNESISISLNLGNATTEVIERGNLEKWLKSKYKDVFDTYASAIDAYINGHAGLCIESCRTCLVSIFEKYKGIDPYAKWIRGVYNSSNDCADNSIQDLDNAIKQDLRKEDLAEFFIENRQGKLTKTRAIYSIYSMLSDYGTHRNEGSVEVPSMEDALLCMRFIESILYWIMQTHK